MSRAGNATHAGDAYIAGDSRLVERPTLGRTGVLRIDSVPSSTEVVIRDLTRDGCGIESNVPVEPGMRVEIGIANIGRVAGTVLWCGDNSFGCMFEHSLPSGSVTAAFGPRNIVAFPVEAMRQEPVAGTTKFPPHIRLLAIGSIVLVSWGGIGALTLLTL